MLHDSIWSQDKEPQVQAVRDAIIRRLLDRGISVVCDDTCLPSRTVRDLRRLAVLSKAEFEVHDMTDVPLAVCLERNRTRDDKSPVPEAWIVEQYNKYIKGRPYPLPIADEPDPAEETQGWVPYEPDYSKPTAIIVDIDGTIALKGDRSPYDESRVHEDRYNEFIITSAVVTAEAHNATLILVSGRTETCRSATVTWLAGHVLMQDIKALFMRRAGDGRKDTEVKYEIFNDHIRDNFNVVGVYDDRKSVVGMWRALGLTVLQCADGDF